MSPTVLTIGPYRFRFYSVNIGEPPHVHVRSGHGQAKFWLGPPVGLARSRGYRAPELETIRRIVAQHREQLEEEWNDFFGQSARGKARPGAEGVEGVGR